MKQASCVKMLLKFSNNRIRDLPFLHEVFSSGLLKANLLKDQPLDGRLIYESDREIHRGFVGRMLIEYLDFEPVYQMALKNYARSLRRGKV